jgi:hypothetical protein
MKIYKNMNIKVFHHNHWRQANLRALCLAFAVNLSLIRLKKKSKYQIKIFIKHLSKLKTVKIIFKLV